MFTPLQIQAKRYRLLHYHISTHIFICTRTKNIYNFCRSLSQNLNFINSILDLRKFKLKIYSQEELTAQIKRIRILCHVYRLFPIIDSIAFIRQWAQNKIQHKCVIISATVWNKQPNHLFAQYSHNLLMCWYFSHLPI